MDMSGKKFLVMLGLVISIAAVISACGPGGGGQPSAAAAGQTFNVDAAEFSYTPNTFNVKPGEKVTINLKNNGTVEHTFVVKDANFKISAQPGATTKGTFTAPTTPGTYQVHCDIAGHTEAGMEGKLIVAQ